MNRCDRLVVGLILAGALGLAEGRAGETNKYGFGKIQTHMQTSGAAPTSDPNPYIFQAFIDYGTATATDPTITAPNEVTYSLGNDTEYNFGISYRSAGFANLASLDAVFSNSGTYALHFVTPSTAPNGLTITSLSLGSTAFPAVVPQITGGGFWSSGQFFYDVYDPDGTITFNPFGGSGEDVIILDIFSTTPGDFHASRWLAQASATSFSLAPDEETGPYFNPGDSYQGMLTFIRAVDADLGESVSGTTGIAFFATQTSFTFVAIPEPSTYALLGLGLGMIALPVLRRRFGR